MKEEGVGDISIADIDEATHYEGKPI